HGQRPNIEAKRPSPWLLPRQRLGHAPLHSPGLPIYDEAHARLLLSRLPARGRLHLQVLSSNGLSALRGSSLDHPPRRFAGKPTGENSSRVAARHRLSRGWPTYTYSRVYLGAITALMLVFGMGSPHSTEAHSQTRKRTAPFAPGRFHGRSVAALRLQDLPGRQAFRRAPP